MLRRLIRTPNDWAIVIPRLILGVVFFVHGSQKAPGWFGGHGFSAAMTGFTVRMHIPAVFAFVAIMAEFLGGIGLVLGFLARVASFGIIVTMLVAVFKVHAQYGFFMNWGGQQRGEGFEYHLLAMALAWAVLIRGAGALSIDRALTGAEEERRVRKKM